MSKSTISFIAGVAVGVLTAGLAKAVKDKFCYPSLSDMYDDGCCFGCHCGDCCQGCDADDSYEDDFENSEDDSTDADY